MKFCKTIFCLYAFCYFNSSQGQNKFYNLNLFEGRSYLTTMNQSNDLMLNSIRYLGGSINDNSLSNKEEKLYFLGLGLFTTLIGQAVTHEEGHRSVLSELGIGSISKPIFDKNFVAKVTGVSDQTLIYLRDNDLPSYVRLHTAGLESDYAYLRKSDAFFNFDEEDYKVLYPDYVMRKLGVQFYYLSNLYSMGTEVKESDDTELERDIVGHDLLGMVRHLHRPAMEFYRYTERGNLTAEEKSYASRIAYMSLLNFLNPNIWHTGNFNLSRDVVANFSVNYSLSPFGDFTEQNAYLTIKEKFKINPYFRQYFNKSDTFLAGGINFHNYSFNNDLFLLNSALDFWEQPKDLDFRTSESQFGFSIKSEIAVRFSNWNKNRKSIYFNAGASYKTDGFIPEAPSLKDDFNVYLGIVLSVNQ